MTKVILFNGPPRCGKDTAADLVRLHLNRADHPWKWWPVLDRFSMPCKRAFAATMGVDPPDEDGYLPFFEDNKEDVVKALGISYRQFQIDFSERFLKEYGPDIFARLFISRNAQFDDRLKTSGHEVVLLVPDSGFAVEVDPVEAHYGKENTFRIKIVRPGFDFKGDSRSYLPNPNLEILNDAGLITFRNKVLAAVDKFLGRVEDICPSC